jgi:CotS family spore coat protein
LEAPALIKPNLREWLNDTILWEYDLTADRVKTLQDGFKIETRVGSRFLRSARAGPEALILAEALTESLMQNGFNWVTPIIHSKYGDLFIETEDKHIYYLTHWVKGKELQLGRWVHFEEAVAILSNLQARQGGYKGQALAFRDFSQSWPDWFSENLVELEECLALAGGKDQPSEFDYLFLAEAPKIIQQAQFSLELIVKSPYPDLAQQARSQGMICHGEFVGRNLIRNRRQEVYVTNFDLCRLDLRMYDLATLLKRGLPRYGWDFEIAFKLIKLYELKNPLYPGELDILLAYLNFPHRFCKVTQDYYLNTPDQFSGDPQIIQDLELALLELPLQQDFVWQFVHRFDLDLYSGISPEFLHSLDIVP